MLWLSLSLCATQDSLFPEDSLFLVRCRNNIESYSSHECSLNAAVNFLGTVSVEGYMGWVVCQNKLMGPAFAIEDS